MRAPKDGRKSRERPGRIIIKQGAIDASSAYSCISFRIEMRCGGYQIYVAKPFAWGIISFFPSFFFLRRVSSSSNEANGLPGYLRPLSRQPSTPLTLDHTSTPPSDPSCPTPEHSSQLTPAHSDFRSRFRYRKRCFSVEHRTLSSCSCSRVYLVLLFPFVPEPGAEVESDPSPALRACMSAEIPSSVWRAPMRARQRSTTWYSFASVLSASSACSCVAYTGDLDDDDDDDEGERDEKDVSGVIGLRMKDEGRREVCVCVCKMSAFDR